MASVESRSFWLGSVTRLLPAAPGAGASEELVWARFNYSFEVSQELALANPLSRKTSDKTFQPVDNEQVVVVGGIDKICPFPVTKWNRSYGSKYVLTQA